jgi:hypothetical protein
LILLANIRSHKDRSTTNLLHGLHRLFSAQDVATDDDLRPFFCKPNRECGSDILVLRL